MEIEEFLFKLEDHFKLIEERKKDLDDSFSSEMNNTLLQVCKESIPVCLDESEDRIFLSVVIPEQVVYPNLLGRSLVLLVEHGQIRRFCVSKNVNIGLRKGYEFKRRSEVKALITQTYKKALREGVEELDYCRLGVDTLHFGYIVPGFGSQEVLTGKLSLDDIDSLIFEYLDLGL